MRQHRQYARPRVRSERIVGQVFANYTCTTSSGTVCCNKFCNRGAPCPPGHEVHPGACF